MTPTAASIAGPLGRRSWTAAAVALALAAAAPAWGENLALSPSPTPIDLRRDPRPFEIAYDCGEARCDLAQFLRRNNVCALLAVKSGMLRLERYHNGGGRCEGINQENGATHRLGLASVTKSVTSTLLGMLHTRGEPAFSLDDPVDGERLLAELGASGYAGVPIRHVLSMRSAVAFDEHGSDAIRLYDEVLQRRLASFLDFATDAKRKRGATAGATFNYSDLDAAVVGLLVDRLAAGGLAALFRDGLWNPLGMRAEGRWTIDKTGLPSPYCCLKMAAPDLARFGKFVLETWQAAATAPERSLPGWLRQATAAARGKVYDCSFRSYRRDIGYGFQWWVFTDRPHEFTAQGIHGQLVHVIPDEDLVIVQFSAWPSQWDDDRECEAYAVHDAIAEALD